MKLYFSDYFGVSPSTLKKYGAFNISLVTDLPLFIDPFLLFNSEKKEYQSLHKNIIDYLRFLRDESSPSHLDAGLLESWFFFPEIKQNWLGYSKQGNRGTGLREDFARSLNKNLHTVFHNFGNETITRGSHLEKLCLIKSGIGRDRVSDFTTNLIKQFLLEYTQRFARTHVNPEYRREISVRKVEFNYKTRSWKPKTFELPVYQNDYVLLTPRDILTKDNTWINKSDLYDDFADIADSIPNNQLRAQINDYFKRCLPRDRKKEPTKEETQEAISEVLSRYPVLIDYYIRFKEERGDLATETSERRVSDAELFIKNCKEFAQLISETTPFYAVRDRTYKETHDRLRYLKDVIENKGGHRVFYVKGTALERESDVHILFRLTWYATQSDVSQEVNDGRGPADFKVARGSKDKTIIEFKLASNKHLERNLKKQVEIYKKASDARKAIKVIVYFTKQQLHRVQRILKSLKLVDSPDVVLIDARDDNKPSGSKA